MAALIGAATIRFAFQLNYLQEMNRQVVVEIYVKSYPAAAIGEGNIFHTKTGAAAIIACAPLSEAPGRTLPSDVTKLRCSVNPIDGSNPDHFSFFFTEPWQLEAEMPFVVAGERPEHSTNLVLLVSVWGAVICACLLLVHWSQRRTTDSKPLKVPKAWAVALALGTTAIILYAGTLGLEAGFQLVIVAQLLLVGPVVEELFFREILVSRLAQGSPVLAAYAVSLAACVVAHVGAATPLDFIFACALLFSLIRHMTGHVSLSIAAHILLNCVVMIGAYGST